MISKRSASCELLPRLGAAHVDVSDRPQPGGVVERSRLCENVLEPRMRRIAFSISFSRQSWKVQLVFTSTKSRRNFYTQVERQFSHSLGQKPKSWRLKVISALARTADIIRRDRQIGKLPLPSLPIPGRRSMQMERSHPVICPTGSFSIRVSSPLCKNIPLRA